MTTVRGSTIKGSKPAQPCRFSWTGKLRCFAAGLLFGVAAVSAVAQEQPTQDKQTLHQTSRAKLIQADAALSEFVTTYETRLSAEQVTLLRQTKETWDTFRQADCAFKASGVAGGSVYSTVVADCLTRAAEVRLEALQTLSQCEEGDLACPASKSE